MFGFQFTKKNQGFDAICEEYLLFCEVVYEAKKLGTL